MPEPTERDPWMGRTKAHDPATDGPVKFAGRTDLDGVTVYPLHLAWCFSWQIADVASCDAPDCGACRAARLPVLFVGTRYRTGSSGQGGLGALAEAMRDIPEPVRELLTDSDGHGVQKQMLVLCLN